jgi:hypothetical protein
MRKPLAVVLDGSVLRLSGNLDAKSDLSGKFKKIAAALSATKGLSVDAADLRVHPPGILLWIKFAAEDLSNVTLRYFPSHLATILRFDEEYAHKHSVFVDEPGVKSKREPVVKKKAAEKNAIEPAVHHAW